MSSLLGFISGWELVVVVFVIVLLFGAAKIPALMRGMGQGIGEFKKGLREGQDDEHKKTPPPPAEPPKPSNPV
jgi:sec-independent protein translocase protein TatA